MSDQEQELYMAMGISELESENATLEARVAELEKKLSGAMAAIGNACCPSDDADRYKAVLEFVLERVQFSKNRPHGVALKDVADVIEVAVTKALEADNGSQT